MGHLARVAVGQVTDAGAKTATAARPPGAFAPVPAWLAVRWGHGLAMTPQGGTTPDELSAEPSSLPQSSRERVATAHTPIWVLWGGASFSVSQ
jgi:hypothetical protein